ncbi:hypothetical protein M8818_005228 [Zalaria obscura]|uniref:Uncharacterized protein n=1 Tax=Zalaria obscura TaxID=2024903 RepID=A0ACC3SBA3_9PEZI
MSVRSLLTLGLAALPAVLGSPLEARAAAAKTTTVTASASTVTVTASASTVTVTASGSACGSITSAPSSSHTTSTSVNTNPTTTETATQTIGFNKAAKSLSPKRYFGTAADIPGTGENQDPYYMAELNNTKDFGQLTPANIMKWYATEPEQGVFNYTGGNDFLALAEANGQIVRCHNLVWYNQLPYWLTNPTTNWTAATLTAVMENHITNLIEYWGDRCYAWDVVNEALNDDGSWRETIFYEVIGPSYFDIAYKTAQAAVKAKGLKVKLYYNDYNIEYPGNKSTAAQNLVKGLQSQKIKIDGVGLQSHFIIGETPSQATQESNMAAFTGLGVDVAVTELDVRSPNLPPTAAQETQQKADYQSTVGACANTQRCVGVTVWDFDDTYSWIPSTFPGQGYGDLFFQPGGPDTPLVKKVAADGVIAGWESGT